MLEEDQTESEEEKEEQKAMQKMERPIEEMKKATEYKITVHSLTIMDMDPEFRYMVEIFGGTHKFTTQIFKKQSGK